MTLADGSLTPNIGTTRQDKRQMRVLRASILGGLVLLVLGLLPWPVFSDIGTALLGAGTALVVLGGTWLLLKVGLRHRRHSHLSLLKGIIAHDPCPKVVADRSGRIRHANRAALESFRRDLQTDDFAELGDLLQTMLANPGGLLRSMGSKIAKQGHCRETIATQDGQVRITGRDVGHNLVLWRVEDAAERDATGLTDAAPLPRITVAASGVVLHVNEAARRLFGKRITSLSELSPMPLEVGEVTSISTAEGIERSLIARIDLDDGRQEYFFLPPSKSSLNAVQATTGFDTLPVPLLELTQDGRILRANSEALRLMESADATDQLLGDLLEGLGRPVADWLSDVASGRTQNTSEFLRVSGGINERFVQVTLKPMAGVEDPHIIAVLSDATELKTLEAQFVQSQKMQAIGQLAGGVAHDFNNLLTAISGHCDLLLLRHDQGDPDYGDLVQINQNANRAAALVSQLLAFSRKQTLRPELLHLRDTLSDLTHLLNRLVGEKVVLRLNHDNALRPVRVDKRQLEQVMMNLVVNARDAMPQGGEIEITTGAVHLRTPLKRDRAVVSPGDYVSVKVTDQGVGISPDKLQKVFEPFYTTKRAGEGTGLGLSTVYGIVKQTGGFIFVDSVVGQGTCFTLMFPVHDEAPVVAVEAAPPVQVDTPERSDAVILLVEDEAPVRAFASRALRLRGFTVLEAESAEEALEKLEDRDLKIDVFVTDVVMPGMDGPRWVREALKARPDTRVVFVSGYAEESFGADQTRIPNSVFLPKPFSLSELTETVQRQLH